MGANGRRQFSATLLGCGLGAGIPAKARPAPTASETGQPPLAAHARTLDLIHRIYGTVDGVATEKLAFDTSGYTRHRDRFYVERSDRIPIRLRFDSLAAEGPVCVVWELGAGDYATDGGYRPEPAFYLGSQLVAEFWRSEAIVQLDFSGRVQAPHGAHPCGALWVKAIALAWEQGRLVYRTQKLVSVLSCGPGA